MVDCATTRFDFREKTKLRLGLIPNYDGPSSGKLHSPMLHRFGETQFVVQYFFNEVLNDVMLGDFDYSDVRDLLGFISAALIA